jgi:hypothetical protein
VIGAGVSAEFGMPVGGVLKGRVAAALTSGFNEIRLTLVADNWPEDKIDRHADFGATLARVIGNFASIDEALHFHSGNKEIIDIGKIAIANEIVKAERNSNLYGAMAGNESLKASCRETWARHFLELALSTTKLTDIKRLFANLTVIDFNYDRILEQHIYLTLQREIDVPQEVAGECLSSLRVLRPYGSIGPLDWQNASGIALGGEIIKLVSISSRIRTYTEEVQSEDIANIKAAIEAAHTIVVLGFGYHKQNVEILSHTGANKPRRIFMTTYAIPEENYPELEVAIQACMRSTLHPQNYNHAAMGFMVRLRPSLVMATS